MTLKAEVSKSNEKLRSGKLSDRSRENFLIIDLKLFQNEKKNNAKQLRKPSQKHQVPKHMTLHSFCDNFQFSKIRIKTRGKTRFSHFAGSPSVPRCSAALGKFKGVLRKVSYDRICGIEFPLSCMYVHVSGYKTNCQRGWRGAAWIGRFFNVFRWLMREQA